MELDALEDNELPQEPENPTYKPDPDMEHNPL